MPITWRPASWSDIEPCVRIQTTQRGDALVGLKASVNCWKHLINDRFFASAVLESSPAIRSHCLIGFGASVFVSSAFADAEVANPSPDITSRIIASVHSGKSVLATPNEVARANAGDGVDVVIIFNAWRDEILSPAERYDMQTLFVSSFAECLAGYRIRRIFHETANEPGREFLDRSIEYQVLAEFSGLGRTLYLMTQESVKVAPGSIGNLIFKYREPVLRLRDSDQQLLLAALKGATDAELATALGVKFSAVKARWRSAFERIAEVMPDLVSDGNDHKGRGPQKRHRVLSYVRSHPEELRPYDWKAKSTSSQRLGVEMLVKASHSS